MSTVDTDRIALSNELHELADTFALECSMWAEERCKRRLAETVAQLRDLARSALGSTDLAIADAYVHAARVTLRNIQGARRFMTVVMTPPHVPEPRSKRA